MRPEDVTGSVLARWSGRLRGLKNRALELSRQFPTSNLCIYFTRPFAVEARGGLWCSYKLRSFQVSFHQYASDSSDSEGASSSSENSSSSTSKGVSPSRSTWFSAAAITARSGIFAELKMFPARNTR